MGGEIQTLLSIDRKIDVMSESRFVADELRTESRAIIRLFDRGILFAGVCERYEGMNCGSSQASIYVDMLEISVESRVNRVRDG